MWTVRLFVSCYFVSKLFILSCCFFLFMFQAVYSVLCSENKIKLNKIFRSVFFKIIWRCVDSCFKDFFTLTLNPYLESCWYITCLECTPGNISWYINRPASTPSNPPECPPGVCWYINRPASTPSNPPEGLPGVCCILTVLLLLLVTPWMSTWSMLIYKPSCFYS